MTVLMVAEVWYSTLNAITGVIVCVVGVFYVVCNFLSLQ